jgi:hypothetical protein
MAYGSVSYASSIPYNGTKVPTSPTSYSTYYGLPSQGTTVPGAHPVINYIIRT